MKKALSILLMVVVLVACQNGGEENNNPEQNETTENYEQRSDEMNEKNGLNEENVDIEQNNNAQNNEETKEDVEGDPHQIVPQYILNEDNWSIEPIADASEKIVLLTIDDAPDKYALEMAHTLKNLDAKAIFFVNGHLLHSEENREALKEIYAMGFPIGNHTMNHKDLRTLSLEEQREEIVPLNDLIEEIIGERPKFFRPPFGTYNEDTLDVVHDEGMLHMNWSYGYDYFEPYQNKERLVEAMVTGKGPEVGVDYSLLKPGANLLMHDRQWTNDGLEDIVNGLRDQGYDMVDPHLIKTENE